jgi:hypothetical protein
MPDSSTQNLASRYPAWHISASRDADGVLRYTARARTPDAHPRTVVTSDLKELYEALDHGPQ